jgi:hypothetical protein
MLEFMEIAYFSYYSITTTTLKRLFQLEGSAKLEGRLVKGRPSVLYRNHIIPLVTSLNAVIRCFHKAYGNFGSGVLFCNYVG